MTYFFRTKLCKKAHKSRTLSQKVERNGLVGGKVIILCIHEGLFQTNLNEKTYKEFEGPEFWGAPAFLGAYPV